MPKSTSLVLVVSCLSILLNTPAKAQCNDIDGDGFFCEAGCGSQQDCNDASLWIYPGAVELCDGLDDDCDGQIDNAAAERESMSVVTSS